MGWSEGTVGGGWDGAKGKWEEDGMEWRDSGSRVRWSEGKAGGGWDGVKGQREEDGME